MKNVSKKLLNVIANVSSKVEKSGYNSHQKYKYIMEKDLLDAVRAEIVEQGLLITSSVENVTREGTITSVSMKHMIIDVESGESLEVRSAGQGADGQDKGVFKAITGANKYFLLKTFLLSGDDDPENDANATKTAPKPQAKPMASKPPVAGFLPPKVTTDIKPKGPAFPAAKPSFGFGGAKPAPKPETKDTGKPTFAFGGGKVDPASLPDTEVTPNDDDIAF